MQTKFTIGWVKDTPDTRDYKFTAQTKVRYSTTDLRPLCPPIIDQGNIGSCTACATVAMSQFVRAKEKFTLWTPSPLFTYYATRLLEKTVEVDCGASVRDAIKSTVLYGIAPELFWRYKPANVSVRPPEGVWIEASKHETLKYLRIDNTDPTSLTGCINEGYPFVFGMNVYSSFLSSKVNATGIVPTPNIKSEKLLGGHCMMGVGYQGTGADMKLIVQNSWGRKWGANGYCYIPFSYITNPKNADDFWTIRTTEN